MRSLSLYDALAMPKRFRSESLMTVRLILAIPASPIRLFIAIPASSIKLISCNSGIVAPSVTEVVVVAIVVEFFSRRVSVSFRFPFIVSYDNRGANFHHRDTIIQELLLQWEKPCTKQSGSNSYLCEHETQLNIFLLPLRVKFYKWRLQWDNKINDVEKEFFEYL